MCLSLGFFHQKTGSDCYASLMTAPWFLRSTNRRSMVKVFTIVPVPDGTKDIYIGGIFTTYNGQVVNRIARIHANGIVASVVTSKP